MKKSISTTTEKMVTDEDHDMWLKAPEKGVDHEFILS